MRVYRDSDQTTDVVWYFTQPNAPQMPFATAFGSQLWDRKEEPPLPVGEQFRPHPWRGGEPPFAVPVGGLCGSIEQWQDGASIADPVTPNYAGTSIPQCCNPPLQRPMGGLAVGGLLKNTPPPNLCVPGPFVPPTLCLSAQWVGTGPPSATPLFGQPPTYQTTLTYDQIFLGVWGSPSFPIPPGIIACGTLGFEMECIGGTTPYVLKNQYVENSPGCANSYLPAFPYGDLISLQLSPFIAVFRPSSGPGLGWQYTVTENPNCPVYTDCCPGGIGTTRTLTISGGGYSGSITALANNPGSPFSPSWQFSSTTIVGCSGVNFSATLSCAGTGSGAVWTLTFQTGTCYAPSGAYNATSVNCNLPSIVFAGLPGGVTISIT
jgi:hypothetical protein